jgi:hypothetical protein
VFAILRKFHSDFWSEATQIAIEYPRSFHTFKEQIIHGLDIAATDVSGQTAVHKAVLNGHSDVIISLYESSADISLLDHMKKSPLDLAQKKGPKDVLKLLGADGWTPLMIAAVNGPPNVMEYLCYRELQQSIQKKIPFPPQYKDELLLTEQETWTWGPYQTHSMKLSDCKMSVRKRCSYPDYSCALGSEVLKRGVHKWAIRVQNVNSMWLGIAQGAGEDAESMATDPESYGDGALIAFHSSGGEPVVVGCEAEISMNNSSEQGFQSAEKSDSEERSSDDAEKEEEDKKVDNCQEFDFSFTSEQTIEFTYNSVDNTLNLAVDGITMCTARNIDVQGFRPYVCMDYSETATLLYRQWRVVGERDAIKLAISEEHQTRALDNSLWSEDKDQALKETAGGCSPILIIFPCCVS